MEEDGGLGRRTPSTRSGGEGMGERKKGKGVGKLALRGGGSGRAEGGNEKQGEEGKGDQTDP